MIAFDYYAEMFDSTSIEALGEVFVGTLQRLIQSGQKTLDHISLPAHRAIDALQFWDSSAANITPVASTPGPMELTGSDDALQTQTIVAQVFSEVFKTDITDPATSFVALGGHSLMAIRIVNRLTDRTGKRISMVDFFANPTIAELANLIARDMAPASTTEHNTIPAAPAMAVYPASH
ncbi:MAG: phosphopantetheine-binding protein, partial [Pseudomonadales bacterium]